MGQKSEPATFDQLYIVGVDHNGNPRGARFNVLRDGIVSAAIDMNCRVLINQPKAVCAVAMKLPVGRVCGSGKLVKLFIPNIRRELYKKILEAARIATKQENARIEAAMSRTIH
jgi:hypothetical protein